jgi:[acyl-carrier-protein] S-malonyltransferase
VLAFIFPGQGSQKPGMGEPWAADESWELVEEASDAAGRDVEHLLLHADAEELKATRNSQLATFVLSLVVLDAVERVGLSPDWCAGHSLGEYSALAATGSLAFDDGVRLVTERGEAMQVAAEEREGTMAAVLGLDDDLVETACARTGDDVWVANYNAPGQVVIAGSPEGVAAAGEEAKGLGAKRAMPLPVSGAFHTPFMAPARDRLRKALDAVELRAPEMTIVANVDARTHEDPEEWRRLLAAQLCSPVRWRHTLLEMRSRGVSVLVELGAGNVLTGMAKRAVPDVQALSVSTPGDLDALLTTIVDIDTAEGTELGHGEHVYTQERLVVSPGAGVFTPSHDLAVGWTIEVGAQLGEVSGAGPVHSPFAGRVMGVLARAGERVQGRQPIAWLSIADA